MAGGGSIRAMTTILRNNRNLLRKKNMFKKERTFLSSSKTNYTSVQGEVTTKKATQKELLSAKENAINNRKVDTLRGWLLVLIFVGPLIVYGVYGLIKADQAILFTPEQTNQTMVNSQNSHLIENLNEYTYLIEEGDSWIEKKNWHNAIYRYEQAVKLFPKEYEANYRLALAYSYNCTYKNKNCNQGIALTNSLLKYAPNDKNLIALKKVFEKK